MANNRTNIENNYPIWDVAFHPSRSKCLFSAGEDGTIKIFDFNPNNILKQPQFERNLSHEHSNIPKINILHQDHFPINTLNITKRNGTLIGSGDGSSLFIFKNI